MEHERQAAEHEGDKYLRLLGLEDIAHQPIPGYEGKQVRDFLDICGEHARPMLEGFSKLDHADPRYQPMYDALHQYIANFVSAE